MIVRKLGKEDSENVAVKEIFFRVVLIEKIEYEIKIKISLS